MRLSVTYGTKPVQVIYVRDLDKFLSDLVELTQGEVQSYGIVNRVWRIVRDNRILVTITE